jgi:Tol biopolymer transport system component
MKRTHRPGGRIVLVAAVRPSRLGAMLALAAVAVVALPLAGQTALAHPPGITERVSVSTAGVAGDDDSIHAAVSGDGRYVAFVSRASTLVPGDTNGTSDVFVRDRVAGTTERVSVDNRGRQAAGGEAGGVLDSNFGRPALSADGRYVAFVSSATNLVKGDRNNVPDVFVRDRVAGTTERVSMSGRKSQANGDSSNPAITADGRFVAFASFADNLVPGDTNFTSDVFVVDRAGGTPAPERVSLSNTGAQAENSSDVPSISADGRHVAFASAADTLVAGDNDGASDVFVRDRVAGTTEGISVAPTASGFGNTSTSPAITPDGRYVAFSSWEPDLVPGDTNNSFDIFVRDRVTGALERVSLNDTGVEGDDWSLGPAISSDGRLVAFSSLAKNLVAGDNNLDFDVFVRDRAAGTTVRASVRTDGTEGGPSLASFNVAMSTDGSVVAFASETDLVPADTGFPIDVFTHTH